MGASLLWVLAAAHALTGCAQLMAQDANTKTAAECTRAVKSSPEGQMLYARLWAFDNSDDEAKLTDPEPLTKEQRKALERVHDRNLQCRQIAPINSDRYVAWVAPYREEYFERGNAILYKLESGEIAVGLANRLMIESNGKFLDDVSKGHPDAVRSEEIQRQRTAEALLQASRAALPPPTTAAMNCSWFDNALNCAGVR